MSRVGELIKKALNEAIKKMCSTDDLHERYIPNIGGIRDKMKGHLKKITYHLEQAKEARANGDNDSARLHDEAVDAHKDAHEAFNRIASGKIKGNAPVGDPIKTRFGFSQPTALSDAEHKSTMAHEVSTPVANASSDPRNAEKYMKDG